MLRVFTIIVLAVVVFGSGAFWTYELFLRPSQDLQVEKEMGDAAIPPDPSLPAFEQCAALKKQLKILEARAALESFLERYPASTKLDEARSQLGDLNAAIFLNPVAAPEKEEYTVRPGDVLTKVAARLKTTPEYLVRANRLNSTVLRIGQKLTVATGSFSMVIDRPKGRVVVLRNGKFFKEYGILVPVKGAAQPSGKKGGQMPQRKVGKVVEKSAWTTMGQRVTLADKDYIGAVHWIAVDGGGGTLYGVVEAQEGIPATKPGHGLGLAVGDTEELSALLRKGDPVTIIPLY